MNQILKKIKENGHIFDLMIHNLPKCSCGE
jgi:hypothetical protein